MSQNGTPVLLVALSGTVSGAYSVTQLAPIHHPAGGDENDVRFTVNYLVTDTRGNSVKGSFGISVDDDTPIAIAGRSIGTVDEDGVVEGIADAGPGDGIPGGPDDFVDPNTDGDNDESTASGDGVGAVPVWCGRAADLFAVDGYERSDGAGPEVWRRCADLCGGRQRADGGGWCGQHGVHVLAERDDGCVDVQSGGPA